MASGYEEGDDQLRNKENVKIDVYALIGKLKEYPKFDYREAMRALYYSYQDSKGWDHVRKEVMARDNSRCVDCGQTEGKLIAHHTSYDNWGLGEIREVDDCVLVCLKCHNKRHRDNPAGVPFWARQNSGPSKEREKGINKMEKEICI